MFSFSCTSGYWMQWHSVLPEVCRFETGRIIECAKICALSDWSRLLLQTVNTRVSKLKLPLTLLLVPSKSRVVAPRIFMIFLRSIFYIDNRPNNRLKLKANCTEIDS